MKLKALFLVLIASLSITHTPSTHSMDFSYKNIALATCATIAGITVSKMAYDYFFSLTDAQEFDQSIKLCEQAEELLNMIDCSYAYQMSIVDCDETYRQIAVSTYPSSRYPFFAYVNSLEKTIAQFLNYEDKLSKNKIHIFERRMKLIIAVPYAKQEVIIQMKSSIESYDFAIEEIQNTLYNLKLKRKLLQTIHRHAITHPQYLIEKQQIKIDELEKKLHAYPYATHTTMYVWEQPRAINHVHVHNTHITNTMHSNTSADSDIAHTAPSCQEQSQSTIQSSSDAQGSQKKLNPIEKQSSQEDALLRDRLYDAGDNFNG